MSITKGRAREIATDLIQVWNDRYEYSLVYEDEDVTEEFSEEEDLKAIYVEMVTARVEVKWDV